jgi:hypothetical protein
MKAYPLKVSELPSVNLEELNVCTFLLSLLSPSTPYTVTWKEKRATTEFFNKRVSASYSLSLIVSLSLSLSLSLSHTHTYTHRLFFQATSSHWILVLSRTLDLYIFSSCPLGCPSTHTFKNCQ